MPQMTQMKKWHGLTGSLMKNSKGIAPHHILGKAPMAIVHFSISYIVRSQGKGLQVGDTQL